MGISARIKPADIIEEIWVREFTDLIWEILRYRRYKVNLIQAATGEALEQILTPLMDDPSRFGAMRHYDLDGFRRPTPALELANKWMRNNPKAIETVGKILASAELTMEDVQARAFAMQVDVIQKIEHLIANAEARMNVLLREIDRHRAATALALRSETQTILDGEFKPRNPKAVAKN